MCPQRSHKVPALQVRPRGGCPGPPAFGPMIHPLGPASLALPVWLPDPMRLPGGPHRRKDALPDVSPLGPCCRERHLSRMRKGKLKAWEPR